MIYPKHNKAMMRRRKGDLNDIAYNRKGKTIVVPNLVFKKFFPSHASEVIHLPGKTRYVFADRKRS